MKSNPEYNTFSKAMDTILRVNPDDVKAAIEAEKRERELQQRRVPHSCSLIA